MASNKSKHNELAINGGAPVRRKPLPGRRLFGEEELRAVTEVFERAWGAGVDFGYQGEFEQRYTEAFCAYQGGGFADGVSSGTAAIYLALAALNLPAGSGVIVSPVTDPGGVAPVCLLGLTPVVADARAGGFNVGPEQFEAALRRTSREPSVTTKEESQPQSRSARVTSRSRRNGPPNVRAAIITHLGGIPADMDPIMEIARARGVEVIEDCSQAHGALYKGKRVGTFGRAAAFSTMFSKNHATGGCGGLVYTRDEELYWRVRSLADRGKAFDRPDFNPKDPAQSLFPALNFNLDELSCAIGLSTLSRLEKTIERRIKIARQINAGLAASKAVSPVPFPPGSRPSLFFHTLRVNADAVTCSPGDFARAVAAEGIWINPSYKLVTAEWPWLRPYLRTEPRIPNAVQFRDTSFNVLFNERFTPADVRDIVNAVLKVEAASCR